MNRKGTWELQSTGMVCIAWATLKGGMPSELA